MRVGELAGALITACVVLFSHGCGTKGSSGTQGGASSSPAIMLPQGIKAVDLDAMRAAMPKGWSMSSPKIVLAPCGYTGEGKEGVEIVFAGPRYVKAPGTKGGTAKESFTVWIMPSDYSAAGRVPSQSNALLLGSTTEHKIFHWVRTFPIPTWPRWQDDLREALKLTTSDGPHM